MSYGFQVTAKSKDEAKEKIAAEVAKIAEHQDSHKHDQAAINNAAGAFIDLLGDMPDGCGLYVSLNGSLGWSGGQDPGSARNYTGSGFSISASYRHL